MQSIFHDLAVSARDRLAKVMEIAETQRHNEEVHALMMRVIPLLEKILASLQEVADLEQASAQSENDKPDDRVFQ